jgi:hypothetical protein
MLWRIILLILLIAGTPVAADTPWPLRTPAELKALHGPGLAGIQILTYRRAREPKGTESASQVVIGIGRAIMFREEGQNRRVVDLRLGRIYEVRGKRYLNYPFAADIVFRDLELTNRIALTKVLAAAGIDEEKRALIGDPFWNSSELKVTAENEAPPAVEMRNEGGTTVYIYKDVEAIRWQPMDKPLPTAVAGNLGRALLWFFRGHPYLGAKLAAERRAPQRFIVRTRLAGELQTDDYQLVSARWCETCEALPADAQPGLVIGGIFENELAPVMIAASQGKHKAPTPDEYLRRIEAALDRSAPLEAWLLYIERSLQDGIRRCQPDEATPYCRTQNRMFAQARTNPDIQTLTQHMGRPSLEGSNTIAGLRNKLEANGYYIDLASVNALPRSALSFKSVNQEPLKSAERRMVSALTAMPFVPAVYRDLGNMYFAAVDTRRAWLAWEMGKANPGRSSEPNLWQPVANIEAQVRRRFPDFF